MLLKITGSIKRVWSSLFMEDEKLFFMILNIDNAKNTMEIKKITAFVLLKNYQTCSAI
jgi:hypothetical protein